MIFIVKNLFMEIRAIIEIIEIIPEKKDLGFLEELVLEFNDFSNLVIFYIESF
jgi:hypothetical protein